MVVSERWRWDGARSTRAALGAWRPNGSVPGEARSRVTDEYGLSSCAEVEAWPPAG